jgi:Flp pilus assembly protein TadD
MGTRIALAAKNDVDGAVQEFQELIRSDPNDADAHHNLGIALLMKGDHVSTSKQLL